MLEVCDACPRYLRASAERCPFCGAPHQPRSFRPVRVSRTRLAAAAAAALMVTACGGAAEGSGDSQEGDGELTGGGEDGLGEQSCGGGRCGSHHTSACMDDEDPCPAPPYGAPPFEETIV